MVEAPDDGDTRPAMPCHLPAAVRPPSCLASSRTAPYISINRRPSRANIEQSSIVMEETAGVSVTPPRRQGSSSSRTRRRRRMSERRGEAENQRERKPGRRCSRPGSSHRSRPSFCFFASPSQRAPQAQQRISDSLVFLLGWAWAAGQNMPGR